MKMKKPVTAQQNCQTVKENNFSIRCDDCSHCDTGVKKTGEKVGGRRIVIDLQSEQNQARLTRQLDRIMINRWLGFPIMILCFALLFAASFMLGKPISSWLGWLLDQLAMFFEGSYLGKNMPGLLAGLLSDGFLRGVGSALAFFPQMLLFFIFYTIITDTGYDARISYIMHGPMSRWLNMNGNCFAPLVLGYSCNVPAIVSAADIPDRVDRRIIMLVTSFVPCSARLGVIIYLAGAFFNPLMATAVMLGLIMLSWLVSAVLSFFIKRAYAGDKSNFTVPELPPYKLPSMAAVFHSAFIRTMDFLNKIKDVVIISSILVWFLSTFPLGSNFEHSYIAMTGKMLEPLGKLAGLNWRLIVALILGFFAKETTLSTLGILYHASEGLGNLGTILIHSISPLTGLVFLVIYMFYIPCIATIKTIRQESGSISFSIFSVVVSLSIAFILGILVYQAGLFLGVLG